MTESYRRRISALLAGLVALDATLTVVAFGFPQLWFDVFHGEPYVDPQGLLKRTAASWLAFAACQALALFRWRSSPYLLVLVAGARFGDVLTDWTYVGVSHQLTPIGKVLLLSASPMNLVAGLVLLAAYRSAIEAGKS
ncbi:MAG: hypothetical protein HY075_07470 [Deltaproteobacteria bacterium]|nr:hypothetical protein [Deltaproteobacteria bacterium]